MGLRKFKVRVLEVQQVIKDSVVVVDPDGPWRKAYGPVREGETEEAILRMAAMDMAEDGEGVETFVQHQGVVERAAQGSPCPAGELP